MTQVCDVIKPFKRYNQGKHQDVANRLQTPLLKVPNYTICACIVLLWKNTHYNNILLFSCGILQRINELTKLTPFVDGPDEATITPDNTTYTILEFSSIDPVTCDCGICVPTCKTQWRFKGNNISGIDNGTLKLQALTRDLSGQYMCTCLNPATSTAERKDFVVNVLCKCIHRRKKPNVLAVVFLWYLATQNS